MTKEELLSNGWGDNVPNEEVKIQSLFPLKEETDTPSKWDKLNKEFDAALDHASNSGYFEKFSLLPESSNPIATDTVVSKLPPYRTFEQVQEDIKDNWDDLGEEQPISSVEKIKVWMPTIWSAPNQVVNKYGNSVQGVELQEGYFLTEEEYASLKANNHLEELEKWVDMKSKQLDEVSNYNILKEGKKIMLEAIKTKIKSLKQ
jgi:hypothetical protein